MAEYIEREAVAMRVLGLTIVDPMVAQYADAVLMQIQQTPAADVAPVVHGRWIDNTFCSNCNGFSEDDEGHIIMSFSEYCPDCGARMDGE